MGVDDVVQMCQAASHATIVAVNLEALNHCLLSRDALRDGLRKAAVRSTVLIPRDGEDLGLRPTTNDQRPTTNDQGP